MEQAFIDLAVFSSKAIILIILILLLLVAFFAMLAKSKEKLKARWVIKKLNDKYEEARETILAEVLPKKQFSLLLKEKKAREKRKHKANKKSKHIYVLNFVGDIKASAVCSLAEEITAILNVATPSDEVVLRLESAGGVVHGYGLAAAQLMRLRAQQIPLTITVDKIAASGGYMMACIANKILAAPFAIVGSIGVIVQLPNFHRLLKEKDIDFEQQTAGEFKRTITMFGKNTEEGREKLQEEIDEMHQLFKNLITQHRQQINIAKVATGEHWLAQQAIDLKLVDEIKTSDDYLFEKSKEADVYEICYEVKKSFFSKFASAQNKLKNILSVI